jgi:hypothetical protein
LNSGDAPRLIRTSNLLLRLRGADGIESGEEDLYEKEF